MNTTTPTFTITRPFDAPRDLVWKAWTQPEVLAKWFGPKGADCAIVKQELRIGGIVHSRIELHGLVMWGKFTYQEVTPPSRLAWLHSFSDEGGITITRHPIHPNWPLELLTTASLEEQDDKTKLTLTWTPINANEVEIKAFTDAIPSMDQGWGGSFDQLAEVLGGQ